VDDEAIAALDARAGSLLQTLGFSQEQAAGMTSDLNSMAAVISATNPGLGSMATVLQKLTQSVGRGRPPGPQTLGIDITKDEIEQRANAIGKTTDQLTGAEKATILSQIALEKLH